MKRNVLLFADFGIDDIFAYMYAAFHKEINLIGVVAGYGNVSRHNSLRNLAFLQLLTNTENVPVFSGAAMPITGKEPEYFPDVHGQEGVGPFSLPTNVKVNTLPFDQLKEIILSNKDITIVNIGRLTSLAIAYTLYPEISEQVKHVYIMGGAFNNKGNITSVAEANIYSDYIAADVVNKKADTIKYIPLDITKHAILSRGQMHTLTSRYPKQLRTFLIEMHNYYTNFYEKNREYRNCSPIHDLLAIWAVTSKVSYETACVKIVKNGIAIGQTIAENKSLETCSSIHKVGVSFSYEKFFEDVLKTFHQGSFNVIDPEKL